jgi:D-proline reductase (dithiol) PrdB
MRDQRGLRRVGTRTSVSPFEAKGVSMSGANFAEIELQWVRDRIYPSFTWKAYDEFSPRNRLSAPLAESTVAFVTTSGAHLTGDAPFDCRVPEGDPTFRVFPSTTPFDDLSLIHRGYDTGRAARDMNVVLPLDHFRAAEANGRIGRLAPTVFSFMGYVADAEPLLNESAPTVAERLRSDGVDLVLLAPA